MNTKMTRSKIFFLALAMAGVSACASPRPTADARPAGEPILSLTHVVQPTSIMLIEFDADNDRLLTRDELFAGAEAEWRTVADAAGTDEIRPVDFSRWVESAFGTKETRFTHIAADRNANGTINDFEFRAALEQEFNIVDKDKDGVVTRAELVESFRVRSGSKARQARGEGEGQRRGGGRRPPRN